MKALRTPDDRFRNLPGYDFAPHYLTVDDTEGGELRMRETGDRFIFVFDRAISVGAQPF